MVTTFVLVATVETVGLSKDEQYCDAWASRARLPSSAEDWTEQNGRDAVTEGCKDVVALLEDGWPLDTLELDPMALDVAEMVGRGRLRLILSDEMRLDLLELLVATLDEELEETG